MRCDESVLSFPAGAILRVGAVGRADAATARFASADVVLLWFDVSVRNECVRCRYRFISDISSEFDL